MKILQTLLLIFLLLSCSKGNPREQKNVLNLAFSYYPATLDPRKTGDFTSSTLVCLLYEGLTRCLPGEEIVEMALAERVDISSDQRVYTFFLKEAYWSDGHRVTAIDFETSWKKILDPSFPSMSPFLLFPILNAESYYKGTVSIDRVGIRSLDDHTLQIELERPTPYFLSLTAFPLLLPFPSHVTTDVDRETRHGPELISNGPFSIEKIKPNSEILLKKNPLFWNQPNIHLDGIKISIVPDEATALRMFENQDLDYLGSPLSPLPLDALPSLQQKATLQFNPIAASTFIAFNTQKGPFKNPDLRKAFALAINREAIVNKVASLGQLAAQNLLPPSLSSQESPSLFFHRDLALHHFQKAIHELDPASVSQFTLYFKQSPVEKRLAQALQKSWKEVLDVDITLQELDPKTHAEKLHQNDFQIAIGCWIAQFHDPINLLERYKLKNNAKNFSRWESHPFQTLVEKVSNTTNKTERLLLLREAESILTEECPITTIYHWCSPSISNRRLKNLGFTKSGGVLFERCSIHSDDIVD